MKRCIFPGSFDPITMGHYDAIVRATELFDEIVVAVMINQKKTPMFTAEQRVHMIKACVSGNKKVKVIAYEGLLAELAKKEGCRIILRGLRNAADFEIERQMAQINAIIGNGLETVFLSTKPEYQSVSSTAVREILAFNGDITGFVPDEVIEIIKECRRKNDGQQA